MMTDPQPTQWWRDAVIYQIYPRSFADRNGDGMGDINGMRDKLGYLSNLGVDAIWLSPFYRSPQKDAGYDVSDYRQVDERFGTLEDFEGLILEAHQGGMKVIVDLVPNHTSDQHEWFQAALAAAPGSPERERYMFRDGKGPDGSEPPNNWKSVFGGRAWTRVTEPDGTPGQWYLHIFDTSQPDLNWENPEVRAEMESVLRFWLDRGVDGFRVDVAHGMIKKAGLPDWEERTEMVADADTAEPTNATPYWDQDGVHEIYRSWNQVLAEYDGDRMLVAEAWVSPIERLFLYVRPDEMQQAFNFEFLLSGWDAEKVTNNIAESLRASGEVGAPPTWVISNHDVVRAATRLGFGPKDDDGSNNIAKAPDEALGQLRARAYLLLMLGFPGSAYLYQGDELGLPDYYNVPDAMRQDPSFARTGGEMRGRDGCRIPMPWDSTKPGYGFSDVADPAPGWLPQPGSYAVYAADQQVGIPGSTFEVIKAALALRHERKLGQGELEFSAEHEPAAGIVSYTNNGVTVVTNMGNDQVELPVYEQILLASIPEAVTDGMLEPNATVWLA